MAASRDGSDGSRSTTQRRAADGAGLKKPSKAEAKPSKPWARERAGTYRSSDGRFRVEQEGPGRWFLVDEEQRDELGLPRTSGPFARLEDAEEDSARLRAIPPEVSPLQPRIARARERAAPEKAAPESVAPEKAAPPTRSGRDDTAAPTSRGAAPPPPQPSPPSWLERLAPDEATRARRLISGLQRLGFTDAEAIVRADLETGRPAVARTLVARRVRDAALDAWAAPDALDAADPDVRDAIRGARAAGLTDQELAAIVRFVAGRTVAATLEQVTRLERDPDAPRPLPGWRFVEHDPGRPDRERRIEVVADDLERIAPEARPPST